MLDKIYRFLEGRYGFDDLYACLLYLYVILLCLSMITRHWIVEILMILVFVIMCFRVLSKNKKKRSQENERYLQIKDKFFHPFSSLKRQWKDRHTFVYKKCHKCKTVLRMPLPSERGIKHVHCPKCQKRLTVLCLRKEKVEIFTKDGKRKR